jgi:hypothetical protein
MNFWFGLQATLCVSGENQYQHKATLVVLNALVILFVPTESSSFFFSSMPTIASLDVLTRFLTHL